MCVCMYAKLENLIPRVLALFLLTHILSVSPAVGTVAVTIAGHNLQSLHLKHINSMRISILELQNPSSSTSSWMLLYLTNQFCVFHFSLVFVLFAECTHITISIYCIFFVFFVVVGFFLLSFLRCLYADSLGRTFLLCLSCFFALHCRIQCYMSMSV